MMPLNECVGRIVKGVNTTNDVGVNQISIEAKKFGIEIDKEGKPKYDYSNWAKGMASKIVESNYNFLLEKQFPREYDISSDMLGIFRDNKFNFDDTIVRNDDLVFYNKDQEVVATLNPLDGDLMTYSRFCKKNVNLSSNLLILEPSYIETEDDSTEYVSMYIQDRYKDYPDKDVISEIIQYFDDNSSNVRPQVKAFVDSLNFNGFNKDDFNLENAIKIKIKDGSLIVGPECFGKIKSKPSKLSNYKNALKNKSYPEELMSYLEQNNFSRIGEGRYGAIYSSDTDKIVIKIDKGKKDPAYMRFADFCHQNKSIHLPKMGKIREFDGFFVLPMEKLEKGSGKDFTDASIWMNMIFSEYHNEEAEPEYSQYDNSLPSKYRSQKDGLIDIIIKLANYRSEDHMFDLHDGNIMSRGDTLVIIDPYAAF